MCWNEGWYLIYSCKGKYTSTYLIRVVWYKYSVSRKKYSFVMLCLLWLHYYIIMFSYMTVFLGGARFLGWMPLFVFFGLPSVSCSMINSLILGCFWPLVFVLNNIVIPGIWRSAISHLPGCFCPWTLFQNKGFNMVPSDPFMSNLATQLGYSAGKFQVLQLIVLAAFVVVD